MESPLRSDDLAWRLADDLAGDLSAAERAAVFLELGCGQYWDVITRMLSVAIREEHVVPLALVSALCRWLDGYAGNVDEPATRALLARVRLHPSEPRHFSADAAGADKHTRAERFSR